MAKESTSKTTATKRASKAAVPPTVVAKGKRGFAALADGIPGLRSAAPAKVRSGAAKRAEPVPAKKVAAKAVKAATKPAAKPVRQQAILKGPLTKLSTVKTVEVRTIGQLNAALAEFKMNSTYALDGDVIDVINLRGRTIGHIVRVEKPAKKAAAKK